MFEFNNLVIRGITVNAEMLEASNDTFGTYLRFRSADKKIEGIIYEPKLKASIVTDAHVLGLLAARLKGYACCHCLCPILRTEHCAREPICGKCFEKVQEREQIMREAAACVA